MQAQIKSRQVRVREHSCLRAEFLGSVLIPLHHQLLKTPTSTHSESRLACARYHFTVGTAFCAPFSFRSVSLDTPKMP